MHKCNINLFQFNKFVKIFSLQNSVLYKWKKSGSENDQQFFEDKTFCRLLIVVLLKMYRKFGQPWILDDQMLKLVRNGQLPTVISSTYHYIKTHEAKKKQAVGDERVCYSQIAHL